MQTRWLSSRWIYASTTKLDFANIKINAERGMKIQYVKILKIAVKKDPSKGNQKSAEILTTTKTVDTKINVPTNTYSMRNRLRLMS